MVLDVLEVLEGTGDLPAVDGLSGLTGVLERNTEVGTASAGGLGRLDFGGGVTDLLEGERWSERGDFAGGVFAGGVFAGGVFAAGVSAA